MGFRLTAYMWAVAAGVVAGAPLLAPRVVRGRYAGIWRGRLGLGGEWLPRQVERGCVWVHALSVGELRSSLPLVRMLRRELGREVVVSVSTAQGLEAARAAGLKAMVRPLELPWAVGRVLRRVEPAVFVQVEGDVWPGWLWALGERGVGRVLVNARMSERSWRRWMRAGGLARAVWGAFDRILTQGPRERERLLALGLDPARVVAGGNIKFDALEPVVGEDERRAMAEELGLGGRAVVVAGSTHPGEESSCLRALVHLRSMGMRLGLVLAPRDVARARAVQAMAAEAGFRACVMSEADGSEVDVVVLDKVGQLWRVYALGVMAFVGGSLVPEGGHNPMEPAVQGVGVVVGPYTEDFAEATSGLISAGGGMRVASAKELAQLWARAVREPQWAIELGRRARAFCLGHQGAVKRAVEAVRAVVEGG